ncbi:MAG: MFS transporter, partial [Sulfobacillus sp.]
MGTEVSTDPSPGLKKLWTNKSFILLWSGGLLSALGDQVYLLAIPWILYSITGSAMSMSTMRMAEFLPNIFLGLIVGLLVDRWPQRLTMALALATQALMVLAVAFTGHIVWIGPPVLFTLGFVISAAARFYSVAYETVIPLLFSRSWLTLVNAQLGTISTTARIVGPAIAGVFIGFLGARSSLWIDAISFSALAVAICMLPVQGRVPNRDRVSLRDQNREAWSWFRRSGALWVATWATSAINLFSSSLVVLAIYHGRHDLHLSAQSVGAALSVAAVGS